MKFVAITPIGTFESLSDNSADALDESEVETLKGLLIKAAQGKLTYMEFEDKDGNTVILAEETLKSSVFKLVK